MPRLHPAQYRDLPIEMQLSLAISEADPSAVWALLKSGAIKPDSGNIVQLFNCSTAPDRMQVQVKKSADITTAMDSTPDIFIIEPPHTQRSRIKAQCRIANMLFSAGLDPLQPHTAPGLYGGAESLRYTSLAQEAFAPDHVVDEHNLKLMADVVLRTLALKPAWKPDIHFIFRNTISSDPESESDLRSRNAEHIRALGLLVGSRLNSAMLHDVGPHGVQMGGNHQHDRLARAAGRAMDIGHRYWWTESRNWEIDPATQPEPTQPMRHIYKSIEDASMTRMRALLDARINAHEPGSRPPQVN